MLKKKEFTAEVAKVAGTTAKVAEEVLNGVVTVVKDELKKGEKVSIVGLGILTPKEVKGGKKEFRNPMTGEKISKVVPDKVTVKFKAEKSLSDFLVK